MFQYNADPRDGYSRRPMGCGVCCSEEAYAVPGEINKWRIVYSEWLAGIQGRGLVPSTVFSFQKLTSDPTPEFPTVLPPTNTDYTAQIAANTAYNGTVATNASSPQSTPLTFALDGVNPPSHGVVAMNSNGTFIYNPQPGFIGVDSFGFTTSDSINPPIENNFTFGIDTVISPAFTGSLPPGVENLSAPESGIQVYETPIPPSQGHLYVNPATVYIRNQYLDFALVCSDEALIGQIYRMTIAQNAMDCEGNRFRHISTYDIKIQPCGPSFS